jgi:DNA processing protein
MAGTDEAAAWVALRTAPGVGDVTGRRLVNHFGGPLAVSAASPEQLRAVGCTPALADMLSQRHTLAAARIEVERMVAIGARLVALDDPEYPPLLRELRDAPLYLIAKGACSLAGPAVAIVGARRATSYGIGIAHRLAEGLAYAGVTVVSGLARGIDGAAHEGALAARGCTIAVLGSGIDVIYPREHLGLAERVAGTGVLLSERPLGTAPLAANFPARNRILAGMTQGTVVIEAAERSGSLITARLANESGREVFAVPGSIDSPLSFGAHLLIREGATLVRDVEDVLEQIAPALHARGLETGARVAGRATPEAGATHERILELLLGGAVSVDELIRSSGRLVPEILASVLDLELRGVVRQLPGRQLQLTSRFAGVGRLQ